jgi:hypothetical protein
MSVNRYIPVEDKHFEEAKRLFAIKNSVHSRIYAQYVIVVLNLY